MSFALLPLFMISLREDLKHDVTPMHRLSVAALSAFVMIHFFGTIKNIDIPLFVSKPSNNVFTIELKLLSGASMAQFTNAINYILTVSFIAVSEGDGLPYLREHLIDYKM